MSSSHDDAVAAFLARGGQISKVAEGASLGLTARDWHKKVRDPVVKTVVEDDDSESRAERAMEAFQNARMSGGSIEAAMDDYNFIRSRR